MARKPSVEGLVNSYTANQLAKRIIEQYDEITSLKAQLKESEKKQLVELRDKIKELEKKQAQQEFYLKSLYDTAKRYNDNKL